MNTLHATRPRSIGHAAMGARLLVLLAALTLAACLTSSSTRPLPVHNSATPVAAPLPRPAAAPAPTAGPAQPPAVAPAVAPGAAPRAPQPTLVPTPEPATLRAPGPGSPQPAPYPAEPLLYTGIGVLLLALVACGRRRVAGPIARTMA